MSSSSSSSSKRKYATFAAMMGMVRGVKRQRPALAVTEPPLIPSPIPTSAAAATTAHSSTSAASATPSPKRRCFLFLRTRRALSAAISPVAFEPTFGAYVITCRQGVFVQYRDPSSGALTSREFSDETAGRGVRELGAGNMLWEDGMTARDCISARLEISQAPDTHAFADRSGIEGELVWIRPALPAPKVAAHTPAAARRLALAGWKRFRAASASG